MKITTIDQLDALPIGSVILSRVYVFQREMHEVWSEPGFSGRHSSGAIDLPATLLHVPGRDLVQEAQADAWDEGYDSGLFDGDAAHTPNPYRDEAP